MKCAKLNLLDRSKLVKVSDDKPKRYCQKRMVNPEHEENPRWFDVLDRFCNKEDYHDTHENFQTERDAPDLCLSVQNLQFQGNIQQQKRPRTSFKYKNCQLGEKHRMFVKEIVDDIDIFDTDKSSELTCYGDYAKYFQNNLSRSSSRGSSIYCVSKTENKGVQVDMKENKKPKKESKVKKSMENKLKDHKDVNLNEDTKVVFHKYGTRKSLTITRAESPETVQVIRVDVVCNYSNSSTMSDYQENKVELTPTDIVPVNKGNIAKKMICDKYFLTKTVKSLDENISGGKVILLCKTYRLTEQNRRSEKKTKIPQEINTKKCKVQK